MKLGCGSQKSEVRNQKQIGEAENGEEKDESFFILHPSFVQQELASAFGKFPKAHRRRAARGAALGIA